MSQNDKGYKIATFEGEIAVTYNNKNVGELMRIPGATTRFGGGREFITLPANRTSILAIEAIGNAETISDSYITLRNTCMDTGDIVMNRWLQCEPKLFNRSLLKHQREFCAWAFDKRGVFNASEQGTGKTTMSSTLLSAWQKLCGYRRFLIVSPKSPMSQWKREIVDVLGHEAPVFVMLKDMTIKQRALVLKGALEHDGPLALAINYEVLRYLEAPLKKMGFDVIIFDESWKVKNPKALTTKIAMRLADAAKRVICLNGSPFTENVGDLWTQLALCVGSDKIGKYRDWMDDYGVSFNMDVGNRSFKKYTGIKNYVGLIVRISPVYWRATKNVCLDLPPKLPYEDIELPMSDQCHKIYEAIRKNGETGLFPKWLTEGDGNTSPEQLGLDLALTESEGLSLAGKMMSALRLQQVTSGFMPRTLSNKERLHWPTDELGEVGIDEERDVYVFDSAKADWWRQYIEDTFIEQSDYRIIMWCRFNYDVHRSAAIAEDILGKNSVARVVGGKGGIKDHELDAVKDSFNSREKGGVRIICTQIQRLAYGHNLQSCDFNWYWSMSHSYLANDQSEDRSHRFGRIGAVGYGRLLANHPEGSRQTKTIDHDIRDALIAKEDIATRLSRDTTMGLR